MSIPIQLSKSTSPNADYFREVYGCLRALQGRALTSDDALYLLNEYVKLCELTKFNRDWMLISSMARLIIEVLENNSNHYSEDIEPAVFAAFKILASKSNIDNPSADFGFELIRNVQLRNPDMFFKEAVKFINTDHWNSIIKYFSKYDSLASMKKIQSFL